MSSISYTEGVNICTSFLGLIVVCFGAGQASKMQTCLVWLPEQEVKLGLRDARPDTQLGSQDARKSAIFREPGSDV